MPQYTCFGLSLHSPISLPFVPCTTAHPADVLVTLVPPAMQRYNQPFLSFSEDCGLTKIVMRPPGVGKFTLRSGNAIFFQPDSTGNDFSLLELFLTGSLLSLLLYQRGLLVLHGSVVRIHNRVIAFLGHSGSGKSSAAAACYRQGHPLFADDITALDLSCGTPLVQPGFPRLKVHAETAEALRLSIQSLPPVHPDLHDEFALPLGEQFCTEEEPLSTVYLLEDGKQVEIEKLTPVRALVELLQHAQPTRHGHNGGAKQFEQLSMLVRQVPIFRLRRPRNLKLLQQLPQVIENHLATLQ